jgi:hypothetical protein
MNAINPYQSSSSAVKTTQGSFQPQRIATFLGIQFLAFFPILLASHLFLFLCVVSYQIGWGQAIEYLYETPTALPMMAGFDIGLWLPHALLAAISRWVRGAGPMWNGIAGAFSIAICMAACTMAQHFWHLPWAEQEYIVIPLCIIPSLVAVFVLGYIRPLATMGLE